MKMLRKISPLSMKNVLLRCIQKICVCVLKLFLAPRPTSLFLMLISLPLASIMLCKLHLRSFEIFHFIKSRTHTSVKNIIETGVVNIFQIAAATFSIVIVQFIKTSLAIFPVVPLN